MIDRYLSSIFRRSTPPQPVTAKGAALIATFYGSREARLEPLVALLCEKLSLVPLSEQVDGGEREIADNWVNRNGPTYIYMLSIR